MIIAWLITFQCKIPDKSQIARYFEIGPLPNVNRALFVTAFETLSVYMPLTRNRMGFSGSLVQIYQQNKIM